MNIKQIARKRRSLKTKAIIKSNESSGRLRLVINRSANHIYAQVVSAGEKGDVVHVSASTLDKTFKSAGTSGTKVEQAQRVGELLGKRAKEAGIKKVAFDRNGNKYHGRVKALAGGAREAGLDF